MNLVKKVAVTTVLLSGLVISYTAFARPAPPPADPCPSGQVYVGSSGGMPLCENQAPGQ